MSVKKEKTALDEESMRFLRRGEPSPAPREQDIAVGPSVIFDEETGRGIAVERSPPPSQLTSTQHQNFEALSSSAARLPRQRPRFHTVQDLDLALNQAIEGKITSKNAWASKEASDLLEGITHTIQNTLDASATADDYAGFAKAATVVEGCSKVWTSRVDSTHQQSNIMVQRLLRNDESDRGGATGDGADGTGEGEDGSQLPGADGRRRKGAHGRGGAAAAARTLALDAAEINLDSKSKTALTQGGMNAQFRAITEKFDQGNAQGLLLNNVPQGMRGNLILDVDYARADAGSIFSARQQHKEGRHSGRAEGVSVKAERARDAADAEAPRPGSGHDDGGHRMSHALRQLIEVDAFMDVTDDQLSLPRYEPRALTASGLLSARNSVRLSQQHSLAPPPQLMNEETSGLGSRRGSGRVSAALSADAAAANAVESLLMVPHTNSPLATEATMAAAAGLLNGSESDGTAQRLYQNDGGDDDGGDQGGDWDDFGGGYDDDDANDGPRAETSLAAELIMSGTDIGAAARDLVSGVASMEAMDHLLGTAGTVQQLALEADDPSAWCPLSQVTPASAPHAALTAGVAPNSELSKLRKEHRFAVPVTGAEAGVAGASLTTTGGLLKNAPETLAAAKTAGKKQKSVVFDLPTDMLPAGRGQGVFVLDKHEVNQSALKPSQTATKNVTPLGRELVLGKDAERAVLAYVQSGFQRTKAEQCGLLLPDVPEPGTTMPSYLPYPVQVSDFFQPFCTAQAEWNLLRKSASGQVLDMRTGAAVGAPGANVLMSGRGSRGSKGSGGPGGSSSGAHGVGDVAGEDGRFDMPVEFFPGGAENDDDYDDGGYEAFGPDDHDDAYDAEAQAANDALRAERFLLAQFNAQQATAATMGLASGRPSSSDASGARASYSGDLAELAKVLTSPEATIPNQVDVVQLRTTMWEALQHEMAINPLIPSSVHWTGGAHEAETDNDDDDDDDSERDASNKENGGDRRMQSRDPNAPLLKKHAQRVLGGDRAKRARDHGDAEDDDEDDENDNDAATPRRPHKKQRAVGDERAARKGQSNAQKTKQYELGLAQTSSDDDEEEESDAFENAHAKNTGEAGQSTNAPRKKRSKKDALPHFSHVVRNVLPAVPSISSTGTLSPAFFFFSILFLANEHNVVLDNVDSLDDLIVRGVAQGVGAGGH